MDSFWGPNKAIGYGNKPLQKLTGKYTIDKVAMLRVDGANPILYYVILCGPRGGKVFCDPLNICDILAHKYRVYPNVIRSALVNYGMNTNRIDIIDATHWDVHNDKTQLRMTRPTDKDISQRLVGKIQPCSDAYYLREKIFNTIYIDTNMLT